MEKRAERPERAERMKGEDRKQAILEAARQVFSATSYRNATTSEVAKLAGISQPAVFRYFPTKRELFLEVLDMIAREGGLRPGGDPVETLKDWAFSCFDKSGDFTQMLRMAIPALAESADAEVAGKVGDICRRRKEELEGVFQAVETGMAPHQAAWMFVSLGLLIHLSHLTGLESEFTRTDLEAIVGSILERADREKTEKIEKIEKKEVVA